MSKKKLALVVILALICGYVNRGLFLESPDDSMSDDFEEEFEGEIGNESGFEAEAFRPPSLDDTDQAPKDEVIQPLTRTDAPQSGEDAHAAILANLAKKIAERQRFDEDNSGRDPFSAQHNVRESYEDAAHAKTPEQRERLRAASEARLRATQKTIAEEKRKQEHASACRAISEIPIHAIICSKKRATVRMRKQNLRVGDRIPETEAIITKIEPRRVHAKLGDSSITIRLVHGKRVRRNKEPNNEEPREANVTPAPTLLNAETNIPSTQGGRK